MSKGEDSAVSDADGTSPMVSAKEHWRTKNYLACVHSLQEVALARSNDPKVKANLAAAKILVRSQSQTPYSDSEVKEAIGIASLNDDITPLIANGALSDSVLLLLNTATVLFNQQQYEAASKLLRPVWTAIQKGPNAPVISEDIKLGICFLLIDVEFVLRGYLNIADTLSWLEHEYDLIPDDKEEIESKVSGIDNANSVHSGDFSQQASPGSPHTFEQVSRLVCGYNLSQLLLNWKARLFLMTGNVKAAKREIRSLLGLDLRNPQAVSLKAELEAIRGNLKRAGKLVTSRPGNAQDLHASEEVQVLCNLAHVQHCEGKYHTAVLCYSKALKFASQAETAPQPLIGNAEMKVSVANLYNAEVTILYSCGVQALLMKQYGFAYSCFQRCTAALFKDPLLWIRMAECCAGACSLQQPLQNLSTIPREIGTQSLSEDANGVGSLGDNMEDTLLHGRQCAANAAYLYLCGMQGKNTQPAENRFANGSASMAAELPPGEAFLHRSVYTFLKQTSRRGRLNALCISAYLSLQLNQPASALLHALDVLEEAEKGSYDWQLGQAYASEALCLLGNPADATEHLQSALEAIIEATGQSGREQVLQNLAENVRTEGGDGENGSQGLPAEILDKVKVSVLVNLASTYFSAGDLPLASEFARESAADPENRDAVLMSAYIQLCAGKIAEAMANLKAFQLGLPSRTV